MMIPNVNIIMFLKWTNMHMYAFNIYLSAMTTQNTWNDVYMYMQQIMYFVGD